MKIHSKYRGVKGFITVYNEAVRYRYMITEQALKKARILAFWEKHGLPATMEAFGVKRRTLFLWKRKLKQGDGKFESLNPKSRAPIVKRKRLWEVRIIEELKNLREKHPNLGADKIHPLLLDFCDATGISKCPSSSTIERLIKDCGGLRKSPQKVSHFGKIKKANRQKVLRKPKDFKVLHPGHTVALDTIEKQRNGKRMHILTAIDIYTRTTFAIATKSHSSQTFAHFFYLSHATLSLRDKECVNRQRQRIQKTLIQTFKPKQYHSLSHLSQNSQNERSLRELQWNDSR